MTNMNIGDQIRTPRFLNVRIAAVFESSTLMEDCGFKEPTYFEDEVWEIRGKSIGVNRMLFAAGKKV